MFLGRTLPMSRLPRLFIVPRIMTSQADFMSWVWANFCFSPSSTLHSAPGLTSGNRLKAPISLASAWGGERELEGRRQGGSQGLLHPHPHPPHSPPLSLTSHPPFPPYPTLQGCCVSSAGSCSVQPPPSGLRQLLSSACLIDYSLAAMKQELCPPAPLSVVSV